MITSLGKRRAVKAFKHILCLRIFFSLLAQPVLPVRPIGTHYGCYLMLLLWDCFWQDPRKRKGQGFHLAGSTSIPAAYKSCLFHNTEPSVALLPLGWPSELSNRPGKLLPKPEHWAGIQGEGMGVQQPAFGEAGTPQKGRLEKSRPSLSFSSRKHTGILQSRCLQPLAKGHLDLVSPIQIWLKL